MVHCAACFATRRIDANEIVDFSLTLVVSLRDKIGALLRYRHILGGLVATGGAAALAASLYSRRAALRALSTRSRQKASRFDFADRLWPRVREYLDSMERQDIPVVKLRNPDELREAFAQTGVPLPFAPREPPNDVASLLRACDAVMEYSVRTGSPLFNNQL
jgi:hypothetical protein